MINITDKKDCCGCNACGDACPHGAISFRADIEGFWYPNVDKGQCTNCGGCERVCPILRRKADHGVETGNTSTDRSTITIPETHAAINKNIEVRFDSTSGGIFSVLADETYRRGGYVGGAIWTKEWGVRHFISSDAQDLEQLRSSKYLQSDATGFYKTVRDLLATGKDVLICGTPCQMAAMRSFLGRDYDNLTIVDFICLGVNSPKVWHKYLESLENRFGSKIVYIKPKNKELGWRQLTTKIVFENGKVLYDTKGTSPFTRGYLHTRVFCRPSCYDCQFKGLPRVADISVSDFWGAEKVVGKELDQDLGTSLVILNNEKGKKYYDAIKSRLFDREIRFDDAASGNPALYKSIDSPSVNREQFYEDLDKYPFDIIANKYIHPKHDSEPTKKQKILALIQFGIDICKASRFSVKTLCQNIYHNIFNPRIATNISEYKYLVVHKNVIFDISRTAKIEVGGIVRLGTKRFKKSKLEFRLLLEDNSTLKFLGPCSIMYGADIEIFKNALLEFGPGCATNIGLTVICGKRISLGADVMIGRNCTIRDNNGGHIIARRGYKNEHIITIGQHSWLCEGCTIMAGSRIGDAAIISAKAVVNGKVPAFALVMGNPATIVDKNVYWKY